MKFAQYYVPAIVSFGLISACYTNLAFTLCIRRESGILKRTRGTPLSPIDYLAGIVGNVVVIGAILTALTIALGVIAYGVTFPSRYLGLVVTIVVGAFCFSAIGVLVSTFVPNEDAAPAIINFLLFPLLFISGTFGTISNTSFLGRLAAVFPVRHLLQQMVDVFNPFASGTGISAAHTLVMLAWGVGALLVVPAPLPLGATRWLTRRRRSRGRSSRGDTSAGSSTAPTSPKQSAAPARRRSAMPMRIRAHWEASSNFATNRDRRVFDRRVCDAGGRGCGGRWVEARSEWRGRRRVADQPLWRGSTRSTIAILWWMEIPGPRSRPPTSAVSRDAGDRRLRSRPRRCPGTPVFSRRCG